MQTKSSNSLSSAPQLLTVRELAKMLNVSQRSIYRWVDAGRMPKPIRLASLQRWELRTIQEWIDAGAPLVRPGKAVR